MYNWHKCWLNYDILRYKVLKFFYNYYVFWSADRKIDEMLEGENLKDFLLNIPASLQIIFQNYYKICSLGK